MADAIQDLLDRVVGSDPAIPGAVLALDAPGFSWRGASGFADPDAGVVMRPEHPFLAASVTKMITASTFLGLVEEGAVDLDAKLGTLLPASVADSLHEFEGRSFGSDLTPRQLLSHTSGLADYWGDAEPLDDGRQPFVAMIRDDPERLWDPREVIEWTKTALRPRFAPGSGWHYTDTGFVLIGLIVEALTGRALHDVMRERVFEPLEMDATYMLFREAARPDTPLVPSIAFAGPVAHMHRSVSADWGGGGLVTTTRDLTRFLRAANRAAQSTWTPTGEPGVFYGLGLRRFVLDDLGLAGSGELIGHTGFVKSFALTWPEREMTLAGTLNQSTAAGVFSSARPVAALVRDVVVALGTAGA